MTIEAWAFSSSTITSLHLPTIMHRFWVIEEMVRLLASDLIKRCKASASAVALACCSKLLSDVVLDSVWEELRGLSRLMRCLPPGSWEIRDGEFVRAICSSSLTFESSLFNRSSYVVPPPRNGSGSRAMLVGYARFMSTVLFQEK